ncbi:MAG: xanthine dehydrogenase family protein [Acidobacteria bacterium]|nr:xanthine dehydrogenase family protein [Acidobacteriota bacterium]MBI3656929.1 xanthine dehydrogenase family protein [Acidobacteriota bacterium]
MNIVGQRARRPDALDKVKGTARYIDDMALAGTLYAGVLRSPHTHARILRLDTARARQMPGILTALTAKDIPGKNIIPLIQPDQPMLAETEVNHIGEGIALVAGEYRVAVEAALAAIEVEYEPLPPVLTLEEAYEQQRIMAHWKIRRGDVKAAFAQAAIVIENSYHTPYQEHAYIEPNGMLAQPDGMGGVTVHGSMQCPFYVQKAVASILGLGLNQVRIIQMVTGGGFGGKEDAPSVPAAMTALLAVKTGRPVKLIFTREDDMTVMSKRHPGWIKYRSAFTQAGELLAVEVLYVLDGGAYATLSPAVLWRGINHAAGPYRCPHAHVDAYAVRTHKAPCGAFRGFGEPQIVFAAESQMDLAAEKLGMDPLEIRLNNALEVNDETITGHRLAGSVGLKEVIRKVVTAADWSAKRQSYAQSCAGSVRRGIGLAACYYGVGLGSLGRFLNPAGANVLVSGDGSVTLAVGTTEIGQGMVTVLAQIAAETLGSPMECVRVLPPDTSQVPDSGPTVASRTTLMSGNAVRAACLEIRGRMKPLLEGKSLPWADQVRLCVENQVHLAAQGWATPPKTTYDPETGQGEVYITYSFSANVVEVEVNADTGEVLVTRIYSGHDVGKVINPTTGEGQIEGGALQGLGYALVEEHAVQNGRIINNQFSTYIIPTAMDTPEIMPIIVEHEYAWGPYGAKGLGETPIIAVAPAVTGAIVQAVGLRLFEIPATPERVWQALRRKEAG